MKITVIQNNDNYTIGSCGKYSSIFKAESLESVLLKIKNTWKNIQIEVVDNGRKCTS